ncbi:MAG: winged helix-turn-helix transcriptional regulator, partial [Parvularculaceae bacterium]|nr:winged helix-turn-helix transcriptional regulator [Parvularculaceae bacterium]
MTYGTMIEALGPPTRRAIFEKLAEGPSSVGALASGMPVSRPAVSQHLKALKDAGLVTEKRRGKARIYSVDPKSIAELRDYFDRFWDVALDAYKRSLEGG